MVKAVTLAFCSIQQHFIRDIPIEFGMSKLPQSSVIGENSGGDISDFRISGQLFIKGNCYNTKTRNDIDMKFETVTKFDKRKTETSKKFNDDVTSAT